MGRVYAANPVAFGGTARWAPREARCVADALKPLVSGQPPASGAAPAAEGTAPREGRGSRGGRRPPASPRALERGSPASAVDALRAD